MEDINHLIERADACFREKRATYYSQLQPGADEAALMRAEGYYGFPLPEPLRALYRWKNGQAVHCYESFTGVDNLSFMSLEAGMEAHRILAELEGAGEFSAGWWDASWVPFLENGGGDHICMEVTPDGRNAGLLWFFHDYEDRSQPDLHSIEVILETAIEEMEFF